jgi:lipid A 3-O-deacylase
MGGAFDAVGFDEGGIEVQLQPQFRGVQATLGVLTNENDTVFSYLGLRRAFEIEPFYFALFTGMGRYWRGDGRELGGDLQFRSGLEAGYRTNGGWRVGIVLYHLSNGGIEHRNPGTETVAVTWGVPLSLHRSFGRH